MNGTVPVRGGTRWSRLDPTAATLWVCIALFFARVVAQVEVVLVAPAWLPEMSAWYSGLLPYPILLPLQIALLMLMSILAVRQPTRSIAAGTRKRVAAIWRALAIVYFAAMYVRLVLCISRYGRDFYLHGAIPVAFHWVLALYILAWAHRVEVPVPQRS